MFVTWPVPLEHIFVLENLECSIVEIVIIVLLIFVIAEPTCKSPDSLAMSKCVWFTGKNRHRMK